MSELVLMSPLSLVLLAAEQKGESEEDILLLRGQHHMYSALEVAWHLCEILFIETLPSGCLIQQLLEWVWG